MMIAKDMDIKSISIAKFCQTTTDANMNMHRNERSTRVAVLTTVSAYRHSQI